jgi:hypothetical protein
MLDELIHAFLVLTLSKGKKQISSQPMFANSPNRFHCPSQEVWSVLRHVKGTPSPPDCPMVTLVMQAEFHHSAVAAFVAP